MKSAYLSLPRLRLRALTDIGALGIGAALPRRGAQRGLSVRPVTDETAQPGQTARVKARAFSVSRLIPDQLTNRPVGAREHGLSQARRGARREGHSRWLSADGLEGGYRNVSFSSWR